MLNVAPDFPNAPSSFESIGNGSEAAPTLNSLLTAEQYRVFHRYQLKFQVDDASTGPVIRKGSKQRVGQHIAKPGPTKIRIGVAEGEFLPVWNNPRAELWSTSMSSDPSTWSWKEYGVNDEKSAYASMRIGIHGRRPNWRLLGLDAPWIYSEIKHKLLADHTVETKVRTSVDITWSNGSVISGIHPFNNLNIYEAIPEFDPDTQERRVTYQRTGLLPMEGQLKPFVDSASGVWPEPPIPPSITTTEPALP